MGKRLTLEESYDVLKSDVRGNKWKSHEIVVDGLTCPVYEWLWGRDDITVGVFDETMDERQFRRQEFFFSAFVQEGYMEVRQSPAGEWVRLDKGTCYIGQPFHGNAWRVPKGSGGRAISVLIKKEFFFHSFASTVAADGRLVDFYLGPKTDAMADNYKIIKGFPDDTFRAINELMAVECANRSVDTQNVLRAFALAGLAILARTFRDMEKPQPDKSFCARVMHFVEGHLDSADLVSLSKEIGYSPAYISRRFAELSGVSLSKAVLEARMKRALVLLKRSGLTIDEVSRLVGYNDKGTFHRAFRRAFGTTPRSYVR